MAKYEYKVVAAPKRAKRVKGIKSKDGQFAMMLEAMMNEEGGSGWQFYRAETLPMEERTGMMSKPVEVYQSVLVFRRERAPAELPRSRQRTAFDEPDQPPLQPQVIPAPAPRAAPERAAFMDAQPPARAPEPAPARATDKSSVYAPEPQSSGPQPAAAPQPPAHQPRPGPRETAFEPEEQLSVDSYPAQNDDDRAFFTDTNKLRQDQEPIDPLVKLLNTDFTDKPIR